MSDASGGRFTLRIVEEIDSTNEFLLRAQLSDFALDTALLALRQTGGRGRAARAWVSEPGGMYLSLLFKPSRLDALALWGAYCVVEMCTTHLGISDLVIRWPNDVYCRNKKLAGILPQVKFAGATMERAVLGVGLNVAQSLDSFPPEMRSEVVTLRELTGEECGVETVARTLLTTFEARLRDLAVPGRVSRLCEPWLEGLAEGAQAFAVEEGKGARRPLGRIVGLGERGELLLESGALENLGPRERLRLSL